MYVATHLLLQLLGILLGSRKHKHIAPIIVLDTAQPKITAHSTLILSHCLFKKTGILYSLGISLQQLHLFFNSIKISIFFTHFLFKCST